MLDIKLSDLIPRPHTGTKPRSARQNTCSRGPAVQDGGGVSLREKSPNEQEPDAAVRATDENLVTLASPLHGRGSSWAGASWFPFSPWLGFPRCGAGAERPLCRSAVSLVSD